MVEMQLRAPNDFVSVDKWAATRKANDSFNKTLFEIANRFGFEVWKDKKCNIRLVNHHLARANSPIAIAREGEYLKVRGFDGKVWFSVDKSKGGFEHEYQHPTRALSDSEIVEPFFNGLKDHYLRTGEVLTFESLLMVINELAFQSKETASGLNAVVKLMTPKKVVDDLEDVGVGLKPSYVG